MLGPPPPPTPLSSFFLLPHFLCNTYCHHLDCSSRTVYFVYRPSSCPHLRTSSSSLSILFLYCSHLIREYRNAIRGTRIDSDAIIISLSYSYGVEPAQEKKSSLWPLEVLLSLLITLILLLYDQAPVLFMDSGDIWHRHLFELKVSSVWGGYFFFLFVSITESLWIVRCTQHNIWAFFFFLVKRTKEPRAHKPHLTTSSIPIWLIFF